MNGADLKKGFDGGDAGTPRAQLRIRPEISELNMRGLLISILVFVVQSLALANQPPVANAGPDRNAYTGQTITLLGSASDPDGDYIVFWDWEVDQAPSGASWTLSPANVQYPDFTAYTPGDYVIFLLVGDSRGAGSALDYVTIHVADNIPPVAVATADKTAITIWEQVCFDGNQSYDPEGGPLTYSWNFGDGSPEVYDINTCHVFNSIGTFEVTLNVVDERNAFDTNIVTIMVQPPENWPPVAYSQNVWCDGSGSVEGRLTATDQDGDPLTFALATPPENGGVAIEPNGAFVYTPDETWDGNDRFGFTVFDGNIISNEAFVSLYVFNRWPVADAGPDRNAYTEQTISLLGSATDPDGDSIMFWAWETDQAPDGASWSLAPTNVPSPDFTAYTPGEYVVLLVVADSHGAGSTPDYATIHVADNLPPEASPTATPSFGEVPLTVQFTANASDPNEDPLTYAWDFGDPLSADNNSTLENPTHIFDQNGIYHVALDVCDGIATINRSITIRAGIYGIDYLLGDIDFDGDVDFADVNEFTSAYLTENGDPDYNSDADLESSDCFIDLYDFALLANDWGKVLP